MMGSDVLTLQSAGSVRFEPEAKVGRGPHPHPNWESRYHRLRAVFVFVFVLFVCFVCFVLNESLIEFGFGFEVELGKV